MRLFIAIDLPNSVKDYLRTVQANLPAGKMSKTHDFHLTLKFLGSCEEDRRKRVEESLRDIPFQSFEATLGEVGFFGGNRPRVIWVDMKVPLWLADSVREIENRMAKLGFEKEHCFTPHITLARVKFVEDQKTFADALKKIKIEPRKFPVKHFYLFESQLSSRPSHSEAKQLMPSPTFREKWGWATSKGATHIKLAEFP